MRAHHLRALAALVTLMSLSMLFSTFTTRIGERLSVMEPVYQHQGRRAVMSADVQDNQASGSPLANKGRTGVGEVIQITRNPTRNPAIVKVKPLCYTRFASPSFGNFAA